MTISLILKLIEKNARTLISFTVEAVQSIAGSGGWLLTVFLTLAGHPFCGGTYLPPYGRRGLPGFDRVLRTIEIPLPESDFGSL
jgi:uncharacterized protein YyaL (SSP411 family)